MMAPDENFTTSGALSVSHGVGLLRENMQEEGEHTFLLAILLVRG